MKIMQEFDTISKSLPQNTGGFDSRSIISMLDLTILDQNAAPAQIIDLANTAQIYSPAAICIYPEHYKFIPNNTLNCKKATVINFPDGQDTDEQVLSLIEEIATQVDEIDYVFPYHLYLDGETQKALTRYKNAYVFGLDA